MTLPVGVVPAIGDLLTGWRLASSMVGVLVLAASAGRLLGTRRSWGVIAVSGLSGWAAGAGLAVLLARNHEHGQAGFLRNLWLFSAFFTMSATVWIECWPDRARWRAAQHRLSSAPRPLPGRSAATASAWGGTPRSPAWRSATAWGARSGSPTMTMTTGKGPSKNEPHSRYGRAPRLGAGAGCSSSSARSCRLELTSSLPTTSGSCRACRTAPRRRHTTPSSALTEELGRPAGELFAEFDWQAIAAASIGQVYRAKLVSGERVS